MRILLDTNVLARAAAGPPGLANELVLACTEPQQTLLLSPYLIAELRRVLRYPRLQAVHRLEDARIEQYVADLESVGELVLLPDDLPVGVTADPNDDPIVATAAIGQADILCTRDRHLQEPAVRKYLTNLGVQVLGDRELLDLLRQPRY